MGDLAAIQHPDHCSSLRTHDAGVRNRSGQVSGQAEDPGRWAPCSTTRQPRSLGLLPNSTQVAPSRFSASRNQLSVTCPRAAPGCRAADSAIRSVTPRPRWARA